jgi:hypothetical protein
MKLSNHSTSRVRLFPFAVAVFTVTMVAALAGAGVGAATPTAARTGGPIAIQATLGGAATGRIVIAGSIGDWGTARSVDRNGNPDDSGNYVKVRLRKGTFEFDSTALNRKTTDPHPQVSSDVTCSVSVRGSAPVTLLKGTGLYRGITGTVHATLSFTGVGGRYQTGAKKGQCRQGGEKPLVMIGAVTGRGTVRFSS